MAALVLSSSFLRGAPLESALPFGLIIGFIGAGLGAIGELIGKRILG